MSLHLPENMTKVLHRFYKRRILNFTPRFYSLGVTKARRKRINKAAYKEYARKKESLIL